MAQEFDYIIVGAGSAGGTLADLLTRDGKHTVLLIEAGGTPELISTAKKQSGSLGIFIRSLVGLEREAAMQAFSHFLQGSTAKPNQIEFIRLIVQELTQNGVMEAERLFESPFTDLNAQGPAGMFSPAEVIHIQQVLDEVRQRAVA